MILRTTAARVGMWIVRHRNTFAALLALAAAGCMALSAYHFRPQALSRIHYRPTAGGPQDYYDPSAPWWAFAGALLIVLALVFARHTPRIPQRSSRSFRARRPRWLRVLILPGVLALFALAESNGHWFGLDWLWDRSPVEQLALFGAGFALVVVGLGGVPGRGVPRDDLPLSPQPPFPVNGDRGRNSPISPLSVSRGTHAEHARDFRRGANRDSSDAQTLGDPSLHDTRPHRIDLAPAGGLSPWREVVLLLALTVLALGVRFYKLGDSIHVLVDEAHFVLGVNYARLFPDLRLLEPMPTTASFPFLFSYGQSLAVDVFGRNLLGLRALSAILGALTVPATYWLGRELFDRTTALIAALVLLTFPPHLHYSRLALNNIADPLFAVLAFALLARGLHTRRPFEWALAGALLGLSQYFYEGGRLIYPLLALGWLVGGVIAWRPRAPVRGIVIAGVAFVLLAAPMYYTLVGMEFPVTDRMDKATFSDQYWAYEREPDNLTTRLHHFRHALLHLINAPENTVFHYYLYYGGAHPLIQEWLVPLALLGFVIVLWRWWEPGILLPPWIIATAVGNALLVESAVSARYVVAFPAIALLIAVGLRHTLVIILAIIPAPRFRDHLPVVLALLVALVIAVGQGAYYFGPHLDRFNAEVREYPAADADDAILRSTGFPKRTVVHLVGSRILTQRDAQHFLDLLTDDLVVLVHPPEDVTEEFFAALRRDVDHAFFVAPYAQGTLALLAEVFGKRTLGTTDNSLVPEDKAMPLYYLPADPSAPLIDPSARG